MGATIPQVRRLQAPYVFQTLNTTPASGGRVISIE
jgi:hypothetical protein